MLLTTHYMLEADELCQRIAIIDHSRLAAIGSPAEVKRQFGDASVVEATVRGDRPDLVLAIRALPGVESAELVPDGIFSKLRVYARSDVDVLPAVATAAGVGTLEAVVRRGRTLEEAYLSILA